MKQETEGTERLLHLVQHGEAKPKSEDPQRPLTDAGRETVEQVAAWAAQHKMGVDKIWHSGKLRAQQTAEIFARRLQPPGGAGSRAGLQPNDDVAAMADSLGNFSGSVMIVGHLPFLSRLVGKLVADTPDRTLVHFRNGGLVGLVQEDGQWTIACVVPPELTACSLPWSTVKERTQ